MYNEGLLGKNHEDNLESIKNELQSEYNLALNTGKGYWISNYSRERYNKVVEYVKQLAENDVYKVKAVISLNRGLIRVDFDKVN